VLYFTYLPRSPPCTDLHQIWYRASSRGRNHVWHFFVDRFRGFDSVGGSKFAILHWLSQSPLTQCSRYRAACDDWLQVAIFSISVQFCKWLPIILLWRHATISYCDVENYFLTEYELWLKTTFFGKFETLEYTFLLVAGTRSG